MWQYNSTAVISHHGVKGMHWGVRRYQNADGTLTSAGKKHYSLSERVKEVDKVEEKKYEDEANARMRKYLEENASEQGEEQAYINAAKQERYREIGMSILRGAGRIGMGTALTHATTVAGVLVGGPAMGATLYKAARTSTLLYNATQGAKQATRNFANAKRVKTRQEEIKKVQDSKQYEDNEFEFLDLFEKIDEMEDKYGLQEDMSKKHIKEYDNYVKRMDDLVDVNLKAIKKVTRKK